MAWRMPSVIETPVVRVSEPYVDPERVCAPEPFAVTVKSGREGLLVQVHRFATPEGAWGFYREATR